MTSLTNTESPHAYSLSERFGVPIYEESSTDSSSAGLKEKHHSHHGASQSDDGTQYPHGIALASLTLGLCLATFLISLDRTIVTTAIPEITNEFNSQADYGWYGSAYLITTCAFQPLFGRVFSMFNIKWSYLISLAVFEIGSLICAVAPNSVTLIVGRAITGVGSAGLLTGSFVVVAHSVPLKNRPSYIAIVGMLYSIGAVAGPILGGVFTSLVSWRWCFYVSLPIGGPTLVTMLFIFKPKAQTKDETPLRQRLSKLDIISTVLLLGAATMFFLALQYSNQGLPWSNSTMIGLLVGAGVAIVVFSAWQLLRGNSALIPPSIALQRSVGFSCLNAFFLYSTLLVQAYFLPIYFQAVQGKSPLLSGVDMLPYLISSALATLITGILVTKIGWYTPPVILGSLIGTIGSGLFTTLQVGTPDAEWIGYMILTGVGLGIAVQMPFIAVQTVLKLEDVPLGTAAVAFAQTLGGSIFISVAQTIMMDELQDVRIKGVDTAKLLSGGTTNFWSSIPTRKMAPVLIAYNDTLRDVFISAVVLCGLAFITSFGIEWRNVKREQAMATATGNPAKEGKQTDCELRRQDL